jgi:hypothetical protein
VVLVASYWQVIAAFLTPFTLDGPHLAGAGHRRIQADGGGGSCQWMSRRKSSVKGVRASVRETSTALEFGQGGGFL